MSNSTQNDEIKQIEKAYGGCHKCYGKGYSTVRYGHRYSADFEGEKEYVDPIKTNIHFCDCDRGKQIKKVLADARREVIDRVESEDVVNRAWIKIDGNEFILVGKEFLATLKEGKI